jgi:hypothetical protein
MPKVTDKSYALAAFFTRAVGPENTFVIVGDRTKFLSEFFLCHTAI